MKLNDILKNVSKSVEEDADLPQELREKILDLIEEVYMDPSPGNMRVLAVVLEKLKDASKYIGALKILSSFEEQPAIT